MTFTKKLKYPFVSTSCVRLTALINTVYVSVIEGHDLISIVIWYWIEVSSRPPVKDGWLQVRENVTGVAINGGSILTDNDDGGLVRPG